MTAENPDIIWEILTRSEVLSFNNQLFVNVGTNNISRLRIRGIVGKWHTTPLGVEFQIPQLVWHWTREQLLDYIDYAQDDEIIFAPKAFFPPRKPRFREKARGGLELNLDQFKMQASAMNNFMINNRIVRSFRDSVIVTQDTVQVQYVNVPNDVTIFLRKNLAIYDQGGMRFRLFERPTGIEL